MQKRVFPVTTRQFAADFACLGADCPDTCCHFWPIDIDPVTIAQYKRKSDLSRSFKTDPDGNSVMCTEGTDKHCVKYNNGLCGIQKKYGEEYLSETCYFYPRIFRRFGQLNSMGMVLSCPESARLQLCDDRAFQVASHTVFRNQPDMQDLQIEGYSEAQIAGLSDHVLTAMLDENYLPEQNAGLLVRLAEALEDSSLALWPQIITHYTDRRATPQKPGALNAKVAIALFSGLLKAAITNEMQYAPRLYQTLRHMEMAFQVSAHWETGHMSGTDLNEANWQKIKNSWKSYGPPIAPYLRRWLASQVHMNRIPFSGQDSGIKRRGAILAVNFACVRLALLCASHVQERALEEQEVLRIVQSLSRILDHVTDMDLFLSFYDSIDLNSETQLLALIGEE